MIKHQKNRIRLAHFSRWTRKSYAAFASLGKVIKISFLSVSLTLSVLPQKSEAQKITTDESDTLSKELEEVEISGELASQVQNEKSRMITVVLPSQISQSPVSSINDLLNNLSIIDLRQRGPEGIQADISIGGGNFNQVLILLNGIPVNDPQTGHNNLDLPVSLSDVERIEVLSGPASRLFGPDSFSGAVNIITKKAHKRGLYLRAKAGDFGLFRAGGQVAFKFKNTSNLVSLSYGKSKGYTDNTDFRKANFYYSVNSVFHKSTLSFQTAAAIKNFGAQSFYTPKFPNQYEATKNAFAAGEYKSYGRFSTVTAVYFRLHTDRFELFRNMEEAPSWYSAHNFHFTKRAGVNFSVSTQGKVGKTSAGVNFRYTDINSNLLGLSTGDTLKGLCDRDAFYTKFDERNTLSFFLEHRLTLGKAVITAGFMTNRYSGDNGVLRVFPGIDFSCSLSKYGTFFLSFNTALRQPDFTELYYQGPSNSSNPFLKPESLMQFESAYRFVKEGLNVQASLHYAKGKNTIDRVKKTENEKWKPMNISSTESFGYNVSVKFVPKSSFASKLAENISVSLSQNIMNNDAGAYISHYVDDYLRLHMVLSAIHPLSKRFYFSWVLNFFNRNGDFFFYDRASGKEYLMPYGSHWLADIKVFYRAPAIEFYCEVSNLFNASYYDYGNVPAPGRWFSLGVQFKVE